MKRTHPSTLVAFVLAGLVVGYLADMATVSGGSKAIVPPISLPVTLTGVAIFVVVLAWPIRRAAVLAKACSLSGALVFGFGLGITLFLLTRSVVPAAETVLLALATAIGAALLMAGGLIAEAFCTLPPDDPEAEKEEHAHA